MEGEKAKNIVAIYGKYIFFFRSFADLSPLSNRVFRTETALDIPQDRFFIKIYVPPGEYDR